MVFAMSERYCLKDRDLLAVQPVPIPDIRQGPGELYPYMRQLLWRSMPSPDHVCQGRSCFGKDNDGDLQEVYFRQR
jgi:hypothetical protein